jgi:GT2 family glycosyltransferase/glycosyltransferase involved in cell wall biosynthesis
MTFDPDKADIEEKARIIAQRDEAIAWLQGELLETRRMRDRIQAVNESLAAQLEAIFNSRGWRALMRYRRLKERYRRLFRRPQSALVSSQPLDAHRAIELRTPASTAPPPSPAATPDPAALTHESLTLVPTLIPEEVMAVLDVPRADARRRRYDVICFSIVDWEFRYQRPQQIMSQFAAHGHRVFYISTSRFRSPGYPTGVSARLIKDNVYEVQLAAPQAVDVYGGAIGGANHGPLVDSLAELRDAYGISSAVAYVMIASWSKIALEAGQRWDWPVVYDCMDEWESFPGVKPELVDAEADLVRNCTLLVVTAKRLYDKWKSTGPPIVLARNGVDYEFYASRCRPNGLLAGATHPIIGYCGAIADWFDVDLVCHAARERPQYTFVLLGGVFDVDVSSLEALPNVSLLGQQPYATMPQYVYHFNACLIPFKINKTTEATDPVKLYEYLSAGKPVVASALPELEPYSDLVYLAGTREAFVTALDRAVAEHDRDLVARRRRFAAEQTWQDRYARISAAVTDVVRPVSIVMVTYNNLTLTKLCLESVLHNTDYPRWEIVVVDNASSDGTPAYLRYLASHYPDVHVTLNTTNLGFPSATNQGLAISRGEYLVLLNNDTIVPHGWLSRLVHHLHDPTIGLVGPVTNFVGNEARVDVPYTSWSQMELYAAERARRCAGQIADIHMLAMFCAAMRRDTYERVGSLDEGFGIGMFEDDDYAQRMRAAGYRVVCAADAFVHHVGQAAFKRLIERGEYDDLFEKNRKLYEKKWRVTWRRHQHAPLTFRPSRAEHSGAALETDPT